MRHNKFFIIFLSALSIVITSNPRIDASIVDNPSELLGTVEYVDIILDDIQDCTQITGEIFDAFLTETSRDINNNITRQEVAERIEIAAAEYPEVRALQADLAMFVIAGWLPSHPAKDMAVGILEMAMGIVMLIVGERGMVTSTIASVMIGDGFRRVVGSLIHISEAMMREERKTPQHEATGY